MIRRAFLFFWLLFLYAFVGLAQTKALDSMADAAAKAAKKGLYNKADSLYGNYVTSFRQQGLEKSYQYSEILAYLARRAMQTGNPDSAISLQKEVIEVKRTAADCNYTQWASAISDLASLYSAKGDYTHAIEAGQTALGMLEKKLGKKHNIYNIVLSNQAAYYAARGGQGDYGKAVLLGESAVKNLKKGTAEYASALNALVVYYTQNGDLANARSVSRKALEEAHKLLGTDGAHYATVLNNQAVQLAKAGNYEAAIEFAQQAKNYYERAGRTKTHAYAKLLNNMATLFSHQHNYKGAIDLLRQALSIFEQTVDKQHSDYLRCLSDLSAAYKADGNLDKADELANKTSSIYGMDSIDGDTKYAVSLSKQASVFASNGNYQRAIEQEQKAYAIFHKRNDTNSMAVSLGHIATYWAGDGQHDKAYKTAQQALNIFRISQKEDVHYAQALNNTALICYQGQKYHDASQYGKEAQQIYEHIGDTANVIYARILANNALFAFVNDQLDSAIDWARKALDIQVGILGNDHPDLIPLLYNLAVFYNKKGYRAEAEQRYLHALALQSHDVSTNFLHLTSMEREKYWHQKNYLFKYAPMLAYQDPHNAEIATMAYNASLFQKGILLNSDIDFRALIKSSGNNDLYQKYTKLEELQHQLTDYHKQPSWKKEVTQQIQSEIYQLERTLVRECKEYGSFTNELNVDVSQICQALKKDEAAIEFVDIYINGRGNTYLALLVKHEQNHPKMLRLFSDDELDELGYGGHHFTKSMQTPSGIDSIYSDVRLGKMVWKPILNELNGVRKLYFSPTSLFYQLGIEYLPCDSAHRISDIFEVYRVSSTKMLTKQDGRSSAIRSAAVYGGLNYDMSLNQIQEQHNSAASHEANFMTELETTDLSRAMDSLSLRGSVGYLPGTLREAENVGELLMQKDIPTKMLVGNEGTEESLKSLKGQNISILHVATHGFFISEKDIRKQNRRLAFVDEQTENLRNPLNYSGILLSGANYALRGGKLPANLDDGILTANEISRIDLSKTDMVVLSACQTGTGEIRDDGVFGIQRGFKKAGVRTLLMSLWNVNDEATTMMMTLFYQNLMAGFSKQVSFKNAQQEMRQSKYSNPFYWASFVLLDGF